MEGISYVGGLGLGLGVGLSKWADRGLTLLSYKGKDWFSGPVVLLAHLAELSPHTCSDTVLITYPLGGGYVLFSPLFLTALSLSLSQSVISYLLFGITRPLLERE